MTRVSDSCAFCCLTHMFWLKLLSLQHDTPGCSCRHIYFSCVLLAWFVFSLRCPILMSASRLECISLSPISDTIDLFSLAALWHCSCSVASSLIAAWQSVGGHGIGFHRVQCCLSLVHGEIQKKRAFWAVLRYFAEQLLLFGVVHVLNNNSIICWE